MEGKRRDEEKMQDSLVVVKFPLVPFATCVLHLQLLPQGPFHFVREFMLLLDGISVGGQRARGTEDSAL